MCHMCRGSGFRDRAEAVQVLLHGDGVLVERGAELPEGLQLTLGAGGQSQRGSISMNLVTILTFLHSVDMTQKPHTQIHSK